MKLRSVLLCLAVGCVLFYCAAESARNRLGQKQRNLRDYCRAARRRGSRDPGTALELHAYFDLTANNRGFACLKVTACHGTPVCFVTKQPHLQNKSINDTTTWQDLMSFIQRDRRIEPIYDSSMDGLNGDKYKALSQYVGPTYQAAIYRMCQDATVYRFVSSHVNNSNSSRPVNGSTTRPPITTATPIRGCPMLQKNRKKNTRVKKREQRNSTNNLLHCTGLSCPCERICVGQGKKRNFSDCATFRIICTFNCGVGLFPFPGVNPVQKSPKKTRKNKRKRRQRLRKAKRKQGQAKKAGKAG